MLNLLHARARALVDAEINLSSPVIFADVASKGTTSLGVQRADYSRAV